MLNFFANLKKNYGKYTTPARRIADSCLEGGVEEPTYTDGKGFVTVCFRRSSSIGTQTNTQTSTQTSTQTTIEAILEQIRNNPEISREQLAKIQAQA